MGFTYWLKVAGSWLLVGASFGFGYFGMYVIANCLDDWRERRTRKPRAA